MSLNYFNAEHHVATYNKFRPSPPKSLIQCVVDFAKEKLPEPLELAVDVGCGSGQSTEILAPYFKKIFGLDSNEQIIQEARKKCHHMNIFYNTCQGEQLDLDDNSADVVTVCQAIHWFDLPKFLCEAKRIIKINGVLALYGYCLPTCICEGNKEVETLVEKYYKNVLADYTLPQSRKAYLEKYSSKEFNYVNFIEGGQMNRMDDFFLEIEGTLNDIVGYMASWSAFQNFTKQMGEERGKKLLQQFKNEFKLLSGDSIMDIFKIRFNYFLLLGRKY